MNRIIYDKEADSLLILWAKNKPAVSRDIGSEFWLRIVPETDKIIGIEIENFKAFAQKHQLFPQPLGNKELLEGIADVFWKSQCCQLCSGSLPNRLNPQGQCSKQKRLECLAKHIDQILALLQPKIEEAIKQERERIFKALDKVQGCYFCGDILREVQALSGKGGAGK